MKNWFIFLHIFQLVFCQKGPPPPGGGPPPEGGPPPSGEGPPPPRRGPPSAEDIAGLINDDPYWKTVAITMTCLALIALCVAFFICQRVLVKFNMFKISLIISYILLFISLCLNMPKLTMGSTIIAQDVSPLVGHAAQFLFFISILIRYRDFLPVIGLWHVSGSRAKWFKKVIVMNAHWITGIICVILITRVYLRQIRSINAYPILSEIIGWYPESIFDIFSSIVGLALDLFMYFIAVLNRAKVGHNKKQIMQISFLITLQCALLIATFTFVFVKRGNYLYLSICQTLRGMFCTCGSVFLIFLRNGIKTMNSSVNSSGTEDMKIQSLKD